VTGGDEGADEFATEVDKGFGGGADDEDGTHTIPVQQLFSMIENTLPKIMILACNLFNFKIILHSRTTIMIDVFSRFRLADGLTSTNPYKTARSP
jgi:hypothetical protein